MSNLEEDTPIQPEALPPIEKRNVTLPLLRQMRYIVRDFDYALIDITDAEIFKAKDPDEELLHIEFLPDVPDKARLWRIKAWRLDYNRQLQMREKAAKDRRVANIFSENREKLIAHFIRGTALPEKDVIPLVNRMLSRKNIFTKAKILGIPLEEP